VRAPWQHELDPGGAIPSQAKWSRVPAVHPFRAWRPRPELATDVASPPYDVISTAEARAMAAGNPVSFLHVTRPEIDLPETMDEHSDEVHRQGWRAWDQLRHHGVFVCDERPVYTVYRQQMGDVVQVGIVGLVDVDDYANGLIRKHELTRPDKEDDRTRHIEALDAHDEPVFLIHPHDDGLQATLESAMSDAPDVHFTTSDGIDHTLWTVMDPTVIERIAAAFEAMNALYIADGHHRSAAAQRLRDDRARRGEPIDEADRFLAVVFAEDRLHVMPYNRVVTDLQGCTPAELLDELRRSFDLSSSDTPVAPHERHVFGVYLDGQWWRASVRPDLVDETSPTARLDVSVLQDLVLAPLLGITDPRTDARIAFVGGIRGTDELKRLVDSGEFAIAFTLCATSVRDLQELADAGQIMPPKSTWFEPKLRSGLFVHALD
jgi:uncharacterized protein (DUF1015 family)